MLRIISEEEMNAEIKTAENNVELLFVFEKTEKPEKPNFILHFFMFPDFSQFPCKINID